MCAVAVSESDRKDGAASHLRVAAEQGKIRLQRSEGLARIAFKRFQDRTVLADLYQGGSAKVRLPKPHGGQSPEGVIINTTGGLTDGDCFRVDAAWAEGTTATMTTQAAERIYRSRGEDAVVDTRLDIAANATGLWLPQETILFDGGRVRRTLEAAVHETGRLLALEAVVFGRKAMGESVHSGSLFDRWRIRFGGKLVFADGVRLEDDIAAMLARPAVLNGGCAMATMIYAGAGCEDLLDPLRQCAANFDAKIGCSRMGPTVVLRMVANSGAELRAALAGVAEAALAHIEPTMQLPRVWHL